MIPGPTLRVETYMEQEFTLFGLPRRRTGFYAPILVRLVGREPGGAMLSPAGVRPQAVDSPKYVSYPYGHFTQHDVGES